MGYEIDFLPVGNGNRSGDAIAVRYGTPGNYTIMIIDGGSKESGEKLVQHIKDHYGTTYVDYVVNTHPDQDHASGLSVVLEQLEVGELWLHRPWKYTAEIIDHFHDGRITEESLARRFQEGGFKYAYALEELAIEKGIPIKEPYQGRAIGAFTVLSPSRDWYLFELIPDFDKTPQKKGLALKSFKEFVAETMQKVFESPTVETLREGLTTSSDNESSTILFANFDGRGVLLNGDAGVRALTKAHQFGQALGIDFPSVLKFIQIPHHGSKHNVSPSILDKILGNKGQDENKTAFVSAGEDSKTHPRKIVTNAFLRRGCGVYTTEGITITHSHNMPNRDGWGPVDPIKFSPEVESYE